MARLSLAWVAGYAMRQFTCPKAVTHPTTNGAQCRATACVDRDQRVTATQNRQYIKRVDVIWRKPVSTNAVSEIHVGDVVELS